MSDRDRRRWPDPALDQMSERVDDSSERLAALDRRISELRNDQLETRREVNHRLNRIEATLNENFERNFREHKSVQRTANEIAETVKPSYLDTAVKYATIISFLLVPILAAWVASGR
jgi:DNA repair exonuclease SbcCD ATPase subunit